MERITITLEPKDLDKLDRIGENRGVYTRSAAIQLLINDYKEFTTEFPTEGLTLEQKREVEALIKGTLERIL